MTHRMSKAGGSYGSMSTALKDPKLPAAERLSAWCRGPVVSAMYGAGGWSISANALSDLRRWENRHVRSFLRLKRASPDEQPMDYYCRTNRIIRELKPVYWRVLKATHAWTQRWWIFQLEDDTEPLRAYMNLRPSSEWTQTRDVMTQID